MERALIGISGLVFSIDLWSVKSRSFFSGYESFSAIDDVIPITVSEEDLETEKSMSGYADKAFRKSLSDEYYEQLAVCRKIAEIIPKHNRFLLHGSAIALNDEGFIFCARSGTGKSTHAAIWKKVYGDKITYINDDKPVLLVEENRVVVYGTPWSGKHKLDTNTSVDVRGIAFLERSEGNRIERISEEEGLPLLLQSIYQPYDEEAYRKTLEKAEKVVRLVPLFRLYCNMDEEAAIVAYQGFQKEIDK